ncbi:pseudoazurin [Sphingobium sp. Z007]|jgi:pseudoazurin|uniref:pseudoazurin n=1 Tax=Sphingobium sp. Z007 TaxID=627495 RepID=UPI000B49C49B|nr:pseudoazurin [Sphingobium sp. Z007]
MFRFLFTAVTVFFCIPATVCAKDIIIEMKNNGIDGVMVFEPSYIKARPGDRIIFKPTDKGHNAETIPAFYPKGATPLRGAINKEIVFTTKLQGLYGIRCLPHFGMGMIALIQIGSVKSADVDAAKAVKLPPLAKKRMIAAIARIR